MMLRSLSRAEDPRTAHIRGPDRLPAGGRPKVRGTEVSGELDRAFVPLVEATAPNLLALRGVGPTSQASCSSPPGTTAPSSLVWTGIRTRAPSRSGHQAEVR